MSMCQFAGNKDCCVRNAVLDKDSKTQNCQLCQINTLESGHLLPYFYWQFGGQILGEPGMFYLADSNCYKQILYQKPAIPELDLEKTSQSVIPIDHVCFKSNAASSLSHLSLN